MDSVALDKLVTFEFIIDKAIDVVYVSINTARRFVVERCEGFARILDNTFADFEETKLLEKSDKNFANGEFLGFEASDKFITSILNAKS